MLERGGQACFALEPPEPLARVHRVGAKELDRHLAPEPDVFRSIDDSHAAITELVEQTIVRN
jgi:hypothetical protein